MPLETNSSHTCFMIRAYRINTAFDYVANMEISLNKATIKLVFCDDAEKVGIMNTVEK